MSPWTAEQAQSLGAPEEVQVSTLRRDGTLRRASTLEVLPA